MTRDLVGFIERIERVRRWERELASMPEAVRVAERTLREMTLRNLAHGPDAYPDPSDDDDDERRG